ncbi:hypothetical protein AAFN85_10955 [Mucilaginibacter sp. CAU 1740]|uniref:hypothetical protein n=1 Tax=Mucilaginibacter sp. CAU 1740 TaxID=3140365 RepID=UPI00325C18BD
MKKPYLIIIFLLAIVSKSYGRFLSIKLDTGKSVLASAKNNNPLKINSTSLADVRPDSSFTNAKLIRTGWSDGIFNTSPNFYRHDLASAIPAGFEELSVTDRQNFIISVNQEAIKQAKDTVCYHDKKLHRCIYTLVPMQLNNLSADTLKYVNMSCSWLDAFRTDKENISFLPTALMLECYKNNPMVFQVPPHQQVIFNIPVYYLTDGVDSKPFATKSFKIGMSLYKYQERKQLPVDIYTLTHKAKTANIIWSNEVVIR